MKKLNPTKQVAMVSPEDGDNTAYVPVAKATTMAVMAYVMSGRVYNQ